MNRSKADGSALSSKILEPELFDYAVSLFGQSNSRTSMSRTYVLRQLLTRPPIDVLDPRLTRNDVE